MVYSCCRAFVRKNLCKKERATVVVFSLNTIASYCKVLIFVSGRCLNGLVSITFKFLCRCYACDKELNNVSENSDIQKAIKFIRERNTTTNGNQFLLLKPMNYNFFTLMFADLGNG